MGGRLLLGIDEAGRGPVIGPLVIAGAAIDESKLQFLEELGVRDSKELPKSKREELFSAILNTLDAYKIYIIPPYEIDRAVYNNRLNDLELRYFSKIIDEILPDVVIIDSPSKNTNKIINLVYNNLNNKNKKIEIIAENKADSKYPIVSAASILAKVTRDKEIDKIKNIVGLDFGSGYPSDPKTRKAIKTNYDVLKEYIRRSWKTVRSSKQKSLEDFI